MLDAQEDVFYYVTQDGMRRMLDAQEDVFYYVTVMNENYAQPSMPEDAEEGIINGMYRIRHSAAKKPAAIAQLLGSGAILREVLAAAELLENDWQVAADVWSVTSFTELRRDGMTVERDNRFNPDRDPEASWIERCLNDTSGPIIASTDYMRSVADLIRTWVPRRYVTLGTDGYGRSDTRAALRDFFEVDRHHVVIATLKALADEGDIERKIVSEAIKKYRIQTDRPNPWDV
jgi:pyruvate dehydrogenase E1 component